MHAFLETERLLLRRFTPDDLGNLVALDSDPAVMRFLTGGEPTPREALARDLLPRFLASYARYGGSGSWAAIEKTIGDFLGWFSLVPHDDGPPDEPALGYRLRRAAWGKGYATEGARALIRAAFTALGARRVTATTYQDNLGSRRVMEKAGMAFVRAFRLTPADLHATGTFAATSQEVWDGDDVAYALTREDWERQETAGSITSG